MNNIYEIGGLSDWHVIANFDSYDNRMIINQSPSANILFSVPISEVKV